MEDLEGVAGESLLEQRRVLQPRRVLGIEARDGLGRRGGADAGAPVPLKCAPGGVLSNR